MSLKITVENTKEKNPDIKPYLVDVPVLVMVWCRPKLQKLQFDVIRQARPSKLYFISDYGRNEKEKALIDESRNIVEDVDWACEVNRLYWSENQGMYAVGKQKKEYFWKREESGIFLEDDIIPSVSFFRFCAELLEKYKNDKRILGICGMNHLGEYDRPMADYFFSYSASIWGQAYWKRTYESFQNYQGTMDQYTMDEVGKIARIDTAFCKAMRGYANAETWGGHIAGPEFYLAVDKYAQNQLWVVPKKNMISCHGCESGSTHAVDDVKKMAKGAAQIFYMKTYELEREIVHPHYVFPDLTYEKKMKRVMAWHHPIIAKYRRIVGILKRLYYGDGKILWKNFIEKIKRRGKAAVEK